MTRGCVEDLVVYIEKHRDAAAFRRDLHQALATYRDELPCRPSKKERRRLKDALMARGFFLAVPLKQVNAVEKGDERSEKDGKRKRYPWEPKPKRRQAQKTSRLDDWDD